uniref:Toxin-antitoxin system protein n=1 Tax=Prevotella sp. GTC17260 TaxID=3236796 RepID=A0AB33JH18_9BACT
MNIQKMNILFITGMMILAACSSQDADSRFSNNPISEITTPANDSLVESKKQTWQFDTFGKDWQIANQGNDAVNHASVIANDECKDGKALKIYTEANSQQRKKIRTVKQYGAGLYTWRTYISDLGETERTSIGSWLWHDDKHELDFEVGSGTGKERKALNLADDEVIAYMISQANPWLHQKVRIKKNSWHIFQIDLKLVNDKYLATWLIDGTPYAIQQLAFGEENPFYIFCSVENLKFVGDTWPYQTNYGLWDYVTYTPYSYSMEPTAPTEASDPVDPAPEPDEGTILKWDMNEIPQNWNVWTNVGGDGIGYYSASNGALILSNDGYCTTSKFTYGSPVGYGKYTWRVRFPELAGAEKFMAGGTLYTADETKGYHTLTITGWYGNDADRKRLGAKPGQLLLRLYSEIPGLDKAAAVLDPNVDYKLTIELKKVSEKYVIIYSLNDEVLQVLQTNYGTDAVKFMFISSAESDRGWMPGNNISKKYSAAFDYIEYVAY